MTSVYGKGKGKGMPLSPEMRIRLAQLAAKQWAMLLSVPEIALAFVNGELDRPPEESSIPEIATELDRLYNAANAIAEERREKLKRLKEAMLMNDDGTALR